MTKYCQVLSLIAAVILAVTVTISTDSTSATSEATTVSTEVMTTKAFQCKGATVYGSCVASFASLQVVLTNMSLLKDRYSMNNSAESDQYTADFQDLTNKLCLGSKPIITCLESQNFSTCEAEESVNPEAEAALTILYLFRVIKYGCELWLSGNSNLEEACPNYKRYYDECMVHAPDLPILVDMDSFFGESAALQNLASFQPIAASKCEGFKTRTGCVVDKFSTECIDKNATEVPYLLATYHLELSRTPLSNCSFNSVETAQRLAVSYRAQKTTPGDTGQEGGGNMSPRQLSNFIFLAIFALLPSVFIF